MAEKHKEPEIGSAENPLHVTQVPDPRATPIVEPPTRPDAMAPSPPPPLGAGPHIGPMPQVMTNPDHADAVRAADEATAKAEGRHRKDDEPVSPDAVSRGVEEFPEPDARQQKDAARAAQKIASERSKE